jgi:hypothetical protein
LDNIGYRETEKVLSSWINSMPKLMEFFPANFGLALSDREKIVYCQLGTIRIPLKVNDPVVPGFTMDRAMVEGRVVRIFLDESKYGVAYNSFAVPIYDEKKEIIGSIGMIDSTTMQKELVQKIAAQLLDKVHLLAATSQELSAQAEEISSASEVLADNALVAQSRVQETNEIVTIIRDIGGQTNLLGLNAAIEAARIGKLGGGFSVVANEIRKLSDTSSQSVSKITKTLSLVFEENKNIVNGTKNVSETILQVSQALQQMTEFIQDVNALTDRLKSLADDLS